MRQLYQGSLKHYLLDLLYPPRCGGCDAPGAWLCAACRAALAPPARGGWTCAVCHGPLRERRGVLTCPAACEPDGLAAYLTAGAYAGPLRASILRLKLDGWKALVPDLALLLEGAVRSACAAAAPWPREGAPYLLAVPLHPRRKRYRGFNQSDLLAAALAHALGWRTVSGLQRLVPTRPQVGLDQPARSRNVAGAFTWRGAETPPGPIVLVDDVFTTGATMEACANALRRAGSGPVYALALAGAGLDA